MKRKYDLKQNNACRVLHEKTGFWWKISSTINSDGTATVDSLSHIKQEAGQEEQLHITADWK